MDVLMKLFPIVGPIIEAKHELRRQLDNPRLEEFPNVLDKGIIALQYTNRALQFLEELEQELDKTYEENE